MPDDQAWALPVVSDRVVLSHPGFRAWIATREPYVFLAAAAGGSSCGGAGGGGAPLLSGRQLRRLFPQATVADLNGDGRSSSAPGVNGATGAPPPPPLLAGRGLWGWFQWPSGALAPCARRLLLLGPQAPLRLKPRLARALDEVVDALVHGTGARRRKGEGRRRLFVAVHVRRGDFSAGPAAASASASAAAAAAAAGEGGALGLLRTSPPFEVESGDSWDDQGLCWQTPAAWLRPALDKAVAELSAAAAAAAQAGAAEAAAAAAKGGAVNGEGDTDDEEDLPPLVVLCTDDPGLARDPEAVWLGAVTWTRPRPAAAAHGEEGGGLAAALGRARAALAACRRSGRPEGRDDDGANLHMLLDWRLMQRADALLASNSTFSFTAALLRSSPSGGSSFDDDDGDGGAAPTGGRPRPVFLRPCPQAGGFVAFEPWNSLPLLPSRPNLPANHGALQQQRA